MQNLRIYGRWRIFRQCVKRNRDALDVILTAFTILIGGSLLLATIVQVRLSQKALNDSEEMISRQRDRDDKADARQEARDKSADSQTKSELAVAETSVAIVKRNAQTAEFITTSEMRPYLFLGDSPGENFGVGKQPGINMQIENYGKTPGYEVNSPYIFGIYDSISEIEVDKYFQGFHDGHGPTIVSGRPISKDEFLKDPLTLADSLKIEKGQRGLYFIAELRYQDQFGNRFYTREGYIYLIHSGKFGNLNRFTKVK